MVAPPCNGATPWRGRDYQYKVTLLGDCPASRAGRDGGGGRGGATGKPGGKKTMVTEGSGGGNGCARDGTGTVPVARSGAHSPRSYRLTRPEQTLGPNCGGGGLVLLGPSETQSGKPAPHHLPQRAGPERRLRGLTQHLPAPTTTLPAVRPGPNSA